jgi:hypothetical protein
MSFQLVRTFVVSIAASGALAWASGCGPGAVNSGVSNTAVSPASLGFATALRAWPPNPALLHAHRRGSSELGPIVAGNIGKSTFWVSDFSANAVYECSPAVDASRPDPGPTGGGTCKPIGLGEWNGPEGLFYHGGDVYVADAGNERVVVLDGKGNILRVLSDTGEFPTDVAVSVNGTVAVANLCSAPSCGAGNILFYAAGATTSTKKVTGLLSEFISVGYDDQGNLYDAGLSASSVVKVGMVKKGTTKNLDTGYESGVSYPGFLEVARNGSINIDDQVCQCIRVFSSSGESSMTLTGALDPFALSFDPTDGHLWVADLGLNAVNVYAYPAGGKSIGTIMGFSELYGVAVAKEGSP